MKEEQKTYEKLANYSFRIIAKKRYTVSEMRKKLIKVAKKFDDGEVSGGVIYGLIEKIIGRLKELNYLDDKKFAEDFISDRIKLRPRGKYLLTREMKAKGIKMELIEAVFDRVKMDEGKLAYDLLVRHLEKKKRIWSKFNNAERKQKSYHFLYSRGFVGDAIYKAIERCYRRPVS